MVESSSEVGSVMEVTKMNATMFRNEKRKILKKIRDNNRKYNKAKNKAEKDGKDNIELLSLNSEYGSEDNLFQMELMMLISRRYYYLCNRLQLPTYYGEEGIWEPSYLPNRMVLTDKGLAKLRSEIRNERHERSRWIFSLGSLIIGLIAALTGLFAVIGK